MIHTAPNAIVLKGQAGTELVGKFTVSKGTDLGITVTGVKATKNQAVLKEIVEVVEGEKYEVFVTGPPALVPGMTRDVIEVEVVCSDGEIRTTTVPVTLDHQAPITVIPRGNVVFQRRDTDRLKVPGSAPVKKDIQIFATSPETKFKITDVSVEGIPEGVFKLSQREVRESERYVITVELIQSRPERSLRGTLRVATDLPEMPVLTARLYAQFAVPTAKGPQNPAARAAQRGRVQQSPGLKPGTKVKPTPVVKPVSPGKSGLNPPPKGKQP